MSASATKPARLGYGAGTVWYGGKQGEELMTSAVAEAIRAGFRHLDMAEAYQTESACGQAISSWLGTPQSSTAAERESRRRELWITSKVSPQNTHSAGSIRTHAIASIERLQCSYLDLYLIHAPFDVNLASAWPQMESLVDEGLVKNIGVSNFRVTDLTTLLALCRVRPWCNQIELHPHLAQPELLALHREQSIRTVAYSPLVPITKVEGETVLASVLEQLAAKHKVESYQLLLCWALRHADYVLTTTRSAAKLPTLLNIETLEVPEADIAAISDAGSKLEKRVYWSKNFSRTQENQPQSSAATPKI